MFKHQIKGIIFCAVACAIFMFASAASAQDNSVPSGSISLTRNLQTVLRKVGFTGRIESTLESRLGRRIELTTGQCGTLTLV